MRPALQVQSEIGRLRQVLVHAPGPELLAVTPFNRQEYLYDDIIDLPGARSEHLTFVQVLERFAEVIEIRVALEAVLAQPEARRFLLTRSEEVTADRTLHGELGNLPPADLVRRFIEGWQPSAGAFSDKLNRPSYVLPPVPNLFFTRDAAMVTGTGSLVAAMRFTSRWPEEALMRTFLGFDPRFAGSPVYYDGSDERRAGYSLEGGDVHVLRADTLLVGLSERTTAACLDIVCEDLFKSSAITDVFAVVLPDPGPAIHLDMVWTQVGDKQCAVYAPMFLGVQRCPVLHRRRGEKSVRSPADLFTGLASVGINLEAIPCGGIRPHIQEREQWASGCNFFAVAPSQVLAYNRNEETLRAMQEAGFDIVEAATFLRAPKGASQDAPMVITMPGAELVRGGGGPRCMTCPLWRDEV